MTNVIFRVLDRVLGFGRLLELGREREELFYG